MLFTDDDLLTAEALTSVDPEVPEVAAAEGIAVEGENSIIRGAWEECANAVLAKMEQFGGGLEATSGGLGYTRSRVHLTQIVASDAYPRKLSALQRWMLYEALQMFYRAATNRTVSDRYEEKRKRFAADAEKHWRRLTAFGLPVVTEPLPCPGALHEHNAGSWGAANLGGVAGGNQAATTYEVAITWVDGSRYQSAAAKGNGESGGSRLVAFTVGVNQLLRIDITSLAPPTAGNQYRWESSDGAVRLLNPTHWNVYAGTPDGPLWLQNAQPIAAGVKVHTLAGAPALSGTPLDPGQRPDARYTFRPILQRG
ncbi:MAG: hypothetical protein K2X35_09605 [Bryobacteraceae bacterium]|nr:hypothetical protein [Bryobacteraceae bacterium]